MKKVQNLSSHTAVIETVLPVNYMRFEGPQGLSSVPVTPTAFPAFPAEASGHEYFAVKSLTVEYRPQSSMLRMGMIAFGGTNDISRLTGTFQQFAYLEGSVPAQSVTKGWKREFSSDLFHPVKGSRYETNLTAGTVCPPVAIAFTYSEVTDSGVESSDVTLLGELHLRMQIEFSVKIPPAMSASVNITHPPNSTEPFEVRRMFGGLSTTLSSRTASQVIFLGLPKGNPYWGGTDMTTEPPDLVAITSPCDTSAHLRITLKRLVHNADAATAALQAANCLIPHVITKGFDATHGSIRTLGEPPKVIVKTGYDGAGNTGNTHTLLSTTSSIHIQLRANKLPNSLPVMAYRVAANAISAVRDAVMEHPLESCLVFGIGVLTGGGLAGAGYLIDSAAIAKLAEAGVAIASLGELQSSISGSVHTYPLGSAPNFHAGITNTNYQIYPHSTSIGGAFGPSSETVATEIEKSISWSAVKADGTVLSPPGGGAAGADGNSFYLVRSYQATFPANSVAAAPLVEVGSANLTVVNSAGQNIASLYTVAPTTASNLQHVRIIRNNGSVQQKFVADFVDFQFLAPNNTNFADQTNPSVGRYLGNTKVCDYLAHTNYPSQTENGVYMREEMISQPAILTLDSGNEILWNIWSHNTNAQRQCFMTLTVTGRLEIPPAEILQNVASLSPVGLPSSTNEPSSHAINLPRSVPGCNCDYVHVSQ